jgi:hypothetical protein
MPRLVSQRTIVELMGALRQGAVASYTETLYKNDFRDWFVKHAGSGIYHWDWTRILMDMRDGRFFQNPYSYSSSNSITGDYLSESSAKELGEVLIQRLAAFATTLPSGEPVVRSLQLDGFDVDKAKLKLVPLEGPASVRQEEDRLTRIVKGSGLPQDSVILKHITDASSLFAAGNDHPSLNESRSLIQALIDGISTETDAHGKHSTKLPGGTANRIEYLRQVGFFTPDEESAFKSGWGSLSAGSHPGVPDRDQARIGLILALEFGQLLLLKFTNWKANAYCGFK